MSKYLKISLLVLMAATPAVAEKLNLGRAATPDEIAAWDIDIRPDGQGLPVGSGDVLTGEDLYINSCASCHGDFGEGIDRWPVLSGGQGTLTGERPVKTVGSYWPYLSTVYDYVHRAMPFGGAQTLTDDEVYAITAYILYLNDLVDDDFVLSNENFTEVRLPNEEAFFMDNRADEEIPTFTAEPCMENCKDSVEITARAAVIDVTPEDGAAREARAAEGGEEVTQAQTPEAPAPEPPPEAAPAAPDPELVAEGERAFRQCQACHKLGEGARNGSGPMLNGIVGKAAGQVEGFRYSPALMEMAEGGLVWTPENLDAFLTKPRDFMRGTRMSFAGQRDADKRAAIIAYLSTFDE